MKIDSWQRPRLEECRKNTEDVFNQIWGLLAPSPERQVIMVKLREAMIEMTKMLKEPEQITMDEVLEGDN